MMQDCTGQTIETIDEDVILYVTYNKGLRDIMTEEEKIAMFKTKDLANCPVIPYFIIYNVGFSPIPSTDPKYAQLDLANQLI